MRRETMYKKIMVPLDGSQIAETVFPHLETVVKGCQVTPEVVLVQAVEPISIPVGREVSQFASFQQLQDFESHQKKDAEKYLSEKAAYLESRGIKCRVEVITGKAGEALTAYVKKNDVDLVVMATRGRSGIKKMVLGSVAERLLRSVSVPVLMVWPK
jgi:nucleotide-binding universal stress UspA family protein